MDYGKRFKHYRKKAKLTQKDAAELIGVNGYQLGNYETNRSEPSITILKKMSKVYKVSIDEMVGNKQKESTESSIVYDGGYVDVEELAKQLNDITEQINRLNKK